MTDVALPETTDLAIIGAGPGGYVAALRAVQLGLDVTLIEKDRPGGTCLHRGCIPSKALIAGAHVWEAVGRAAEFGVNLSSPPTLDYPTLAARKDKVVESLAKGLEFLLGKRGVRTVAGRASFAGPTALNVALPDGTTKTLSFKNCIVASGSAPAVPPGLELDGEYFVSSDNVLRWQRTPRDLIVVGAGVIGCEFASLFARFGTAVQVVEMEKEVLPGFDGDARREINKNLRRRRIKLYLGVRVEKAARIGAGVDLTLADGKRLQAQICLVAVGRRPCADGLETEQAGLVLDARGALPVDDCCRTSVSHIYAIGDVTGAIQLAHAASHMGIVAAEQAAGKDSRYDEALVPGAVFTDPEIASAGLTEEQARAAGREVKIGKFPFRGLGKAQADGRLDGFVKVLGDARTGELLGIHAVGAEATNLLGEFSLAVKKKVRVEELAETIHAHPTLPEAVSEAALAALGTPLHGM